MKLNDSQKNRLIERWEEYLGRQESSGDNQYGSADGQMAILQQYLDPPAQVVFLGCGDGLEVVEARRLGYRAAGVTLGDPDMNRARDVYGIDLVKSDAHLLPDDWENEFDGVFAFQTLEHSISGMLFWWEIKRILKHGGRAYAEVPHQSFTMNDNWHHQNSPTPDQMKGWLMKLGFVEIETGFCVEDRSDAARWAFATAIKV